ncbi:Calcium sensing receptor [Forsythia ovata]|uniref:Calcium sensing receptor n=1 Tax=Forsythia ovata TaxID=205694 RepID=A0ABD1QTM4_9LAMI
MALRASAAVRTPTLPPSPQPRKAFCHSKFTSESLSVVSHSAKTTLPLFVLFTVPHEAKALTISKEQIVSSLDQVESTINQVQEVGSNIFDVAGQPGNRPVKIASPVVSELSKKAQETIQSSGLDTQPVISAAKIVADAAQQTTKVIYEAKPIASSTVETISSADPVVIVGTGGALFFAYLLLPPIFSAISFGFRGYKGDLTPAQTLDMMSTKNYVMIDIRSEEGQKQGRLAGHA